MNIIIKGRDFSASPLPRNYGKVRGFPADDAKGIVLLGLYLFEDGEQDDFYGGPFADSSGKGNDATIYGDREEPIMRAHGLDVADIDGLVLDTGILAGRTGHTVIVGAEARPAAQATDAGIANLAHHFFGSTADTGTSKVGNHTNNQSAFGFHVPNNLFYERDPQLLISTFAREYLQTPSGGAAGDNVVLSRRVDGPGGSVLLKTYASSLLHTNAGNGDTRITDAFDGTQLGNFAIGAWPGGVVRPTAVPMIRLFGIAIYDGALSDDLHDAARTGMRELMEARGFTVHGV